MPNCHKCPVSAEIAEGKHNDTPWEEMPCHTCRLSEPSHHGATHISINACTGGVDGIQSLPEILATLQDARGPAPFHPVNEIEPPEQDTEPPEITAAFVMASEVLRRFTRMPPAARDRVFAAIRNPDFLGRDLAKADNVSPQAVSHALRTAVQVFPELRCVLPLANQRVPKPDEAAAPLELDRPPPLEDPDAGAFID